MSSIVAQWKSNSHQRNMLSVRIRSCMPRWRQIKHSKQVGQVQKNINFWTWLFLLVEYKMKFLISFVVGFLARIVCNSFRKAFSDHWHAFFFYKLLPCCEHCGAIRGLALEDSRTCYPTKYDPLDFKSHPDDPNRSRLLCRNCAVSHHEYWDEMWKDYYSGRL